MLELEFAEEVVVLRQRTVAFKDLNQADELVVRGSREAIKSTHKCYEI